MLPRRSTGDEPRRRDRRRGARGAADLATRPHPRRRGPAAQRDGDSRPWGRSLDLAAAFTAAGLEAVAGPAAPSPGPRDPPPSPIPQVKRRLSKPKITARSGGVGEANPDGEGDEPSAGARLTVRVYVRGRGGKLRRVASRTRRSATVRIRIGSWRQVTARFTDPTGQSLESPARLSRPADEAGAIVVASVVALALAEGAVATVYEVRSCGASAPVAPSSRTNSASRDLQAATQCPPTCRGAPERDLCDATHRHRPTPDGESSYLDHCDAARTDAQASRRPALPRDTACIVEGPGTHG